MPITKYGFKMRFLLFACNTLALLFLTSCAPKPHPPISSQHEFAPLEIKGARAFEDVRRFVELGLRDAGTPGAAQAAAHISRRLEELGLKPETDVFEDTTPDGLRTFRNVTASVHSKSDRWVLLLAHYDTKRGMPEGFEGANDSGSGVGLLLEFARALAASPNPSPVNIMLGFIDGEECMETYGPNDGLHGSKRLARELRKKADAGGMKISAVIVLDMIGDRDLTVTLPRNASQHLLAAVLDAAAAENARHCFKLYSGNILDDHVPFFEAGFSAVTLIDFEYGSRPGRNDFWHTAEDTMDKLAPESLETVGRVVWRMIWSLAP